MEGGHFKFSLVKLSNEKPGEQLKGVGHTEALSGFGPGYYKEAKT